MGSPLGAAKYNSLLQGAASLDRLGTTAANTQANIMHRHSTLPKNCVQEIPVAQKDVQMNPVNHAFPCV